jgi:hypothetical protein
MKVRRRNEESHDSQVVDNSKCANRYFEGLLTNQAACSRCTGRTRRLDGKQEEFLIALACSDAPNGVEKWTMQ